jgi:chromosome segregation ATPase
VTKTCPICKKRGFQYETRRLYFSSDSQPDERDDQVRHLKQAIELHRMELGVARTKNYELQDQLVSAENGRKKAETLHEQAIQALVLEEQKNSSLNRAIDSLKEEIKALKEKHEKEDMEKTAAFVVAEENINKVHATITKGLHKEIQNYENQLEIANQEIIKLSAMPENRKKLDAPSGSKKIKPVQDNALEQRVKKLEKLVQELQIASKKKHNETPPMRKRSSRSSKDSSKPNAEDSTTTLVRLSDTFKQRLEENRARNAR